MRIAFIIGEFPCLSETFILNQITGLIDRGHSVTIFPYKLGDTSKVHPDVIAYNLLDHTFPASSTLSNRQIFQTWPLQSLKLLLQGKPGLMKYTPAFAPKDSNFDVIHCHFADNGMHAVHLRDAGIIRGPISVVFHGYDLAVEPNERALQHLFRRADLLLPISNYWKGSLLAMGAFSNRTEVHHMGIDCELFPFRPRVFGSFIKLISVARLVEKKGLMYAIVAVKKLVKRYPDIQYQIVGDGPLLESLQLMVKYLRLENNVIFTGRKSQNEVVQLLEEADILLAPSVKSRNNDMEGIPVSIMEAMASGLPVVSTKHSGIPELIDQGMSGYLVEEKDGVGLVKAIENLILSPSGVEDMIINARRKVREEFNINTLNDRLELLFVELGGHRV